MLPGNNSRSFILSLTLTEILILLFFVVLLTAMWEISKVNTERDELEQALGLQAAIGPAEARSLLRAAERKNEIKTLREELQETQEELARLDTLAALKRDLSEEAFLKLVRDVAERLGEKKGETDLTTEVEAVRKRLMKSERALKDAKAQNVSMSRRLKRAGLGFPPCWADEEGKPEYLFIVELQGDLLQVVEDWPVHRQGNVESVSGATELANRRVSRRAFVKGAAPILRWSKEQTPECRHFVVIRDSDETTKAEFKSGMLLVENYFYKYLPID